MRRRFDQIYSTPHWRKIRAAQLQRQRLCVICAKAGIQTPATQVDHKHPLIAGGCLDVPDNPWCKNGQLVFPVN